MDTRIRGKSVDTLGKEQKILSWGSLCAMVAGASLDVLSTGLSISVIKNKILVRRMEIHNGIEARLWLMGAIMRIEDILQLLDHSVNTQTLFQRVTSIGWEIGNVSFLSRALYDVGYLSEEEAWAYISQVHRYGCQFGFMSWNEFTTSYLIGMGSRGIQKKNNIRKIRKAEKYLLEKGNIWAELLPGKLEI